MKNSQLLKEAIADAKAVKETALENAKAVLEEAFTPKLQSMLSQRLQQETEDYDDEQGSVPGEQDTGPDEYDDELNEFENTEKSGTNVGKTNDAPHPMGLTDDDEVMNEGESGYNADDHTVDPQGKGNELSSGPSDQDSDSTPNVDTSNEGPNPGARLTTSKSDRSDVGPGNQRKASDQDSDSTSNVDTSNELHINEGEEDDELSKIIAELEGELEGDLDDNIDLDGEEDMEGDLENVDDLDDESEENGEDEETSDLDLDFSDEVEGEESVGEEIPVDVAGDDEDEEEIDLEEILREMELGETEKEDHNYDEVMNENKTLRNELAEYKKAFGFLKGKLNEVNLLNAKLLFTNKVFKSYGLNNSQKMKVVEAFDRSKNVREVKLTYANLKESFNIVNGNKKKSALTESMASASIKSTKPSNKTVNKQKQILNEGNETAARLKKLAGIK